MESITEILDGLKLCVGDEQKVDDADLFLRLKSLLALLAADEQHSKSEANRQQVCERLVKSAFVSSTKDILKGSSAVTEETLALLVQVIAEAAKYEPLRKQFTEAAVVDPLLGLISHKNYAVVLQACRALGNICYDNDDGRDLVRAKQGVEQLLQLLQNVLEVDSAPRDLHTVVSGCLLNLTDMQEIQEDALRLGVIDILLKYLQKYSDVEDVVMHCVLVLNGIADSDDGRKRLTEKHTLSLLLSNLDRVFSEEVTEVLLELFGNLAESDEVKEDLVELGFCEKLIEVLKRFQPGSGTPLSEEKQSVIKTICDLTVLVLTGDASMRHVYQNGSGPIYKATMAWLQTDDDNLRVAGALSAGNFARKDDHCIQMVRDGVAKRLLDLLTEHTGTDGDIRLQHALLAALRNLAIPLENKPLLAELGAVDKLLSMLAVETFPVVFKLLGTLRMLVDKQEVVATKLGLNEQLVKHLVTWCSTEDHPGVKGESVRLLAWIAKNSASPEAKAVLCRLGALPHWVSMLSSEHSLMQAEGLLALTLSLSPPPSGTALEDLKKADVLPLLRSLLESPEISPEALQNAVAFTTALASLEVCALNFRRHEYRVKELGYDVASEIHVRNAVFRRSDVTPETLW
ncbi:visceral mesodermal armadillo-repeats isoform X3 [Dermacentor variabilis]|uniref:visceral mesodermal armadillo-repeats isoform X3 n=1 Tax=Dermacentor variabilis TaxID=34621 RepID=UPI003F5B85EC